MRLHRGIAAGLLAAVACCQLAISVYQRLRARMRDSEPFQPRDAGGHGVRGKGCLFCVRQPCTPSGCWHLTCPTLCGALGKSLLAMGGQPACGRLHTRSRSATALLLHSGQRIPLMVRVGTSRMCDPAARVAPCPAPSSRRYCPCIFTDHCMRLTTVFHQPSTEHSAATLPGFFGQPVHM